MYFGIQVTSTGASAKKPFIFLLVVVTTGLVPAASQSMIALTISLRVITYVLLSTMTVVLASLDAGSLLKIEQALKVLTADINNTFFISISLYQKNLMERNVSPLLVTTQKLLIHLPPSNLSQPYRRGNKRKP
jgi:hypothetical protein